MHSYSVQCSLFFLLLQIILIVTNYISLSYVMTINACNTYLGMNTLAERRCVKTHVSWKTKVVSSRLKGKQYAKSQIT